VKGAVGANQPPCLFLITGQYIVLVVVYFVVFFYFIFLVLN